jgi:hypothetical protein
MVIALHDVASIVFRTVMIMVSCDMVPSSRNGTHFECKTPLLVKEIAILLLVRDIPN